MKILFFEFPICTCIPSAPECDVCYRINCSLAREPVQSRNYTLAAESPKQFYTGGNAQPTKISDPRYTNPERSAGTPSGKPVWGIIILEWNRVLNARSKGASSRVAAGAVVSKRLEY